MPTQRVAILGATGYTGEELIRLLLEHPHVEITTLAASAKWDRPKPVSEVYPRFAGRLDQPIERLDLSRVCESSDIVFLALPHGTAMDLVPSLLEAGKRVIDLSGDFRLRDPALYPRWYRFSHAHPELLTSADVVYGLTEFHRDQIRAARLVANPGCYATGILLGCLPLFRANLAEDGRFFVDAKSGLTGAGRQPQTSTFVSEMAENLRAYKVNEHQHMAEILQEIHQLTRRPAQMGFVPQIVPISRGIFSTIHIPTSAAPEAVLEAYQEHYGDGRTPFVRLRGETLPELKDVTGTNYCDIGVRVDPVLRSATIISVLDNLTKGAAGQAIQNFNLMIGVPETTGLLS